MSENHAREGFDLHVAHRFPLVPREVADLFLGELDVVDVPLGQLTEAPLDLCLRKAIVAPIPAVEFRGELPDCSVAAFFDVGKNFLHRRADLGRILGPECRVAATLEIFSHVDLPRYLMA